MSLKHPLYCSSQKQRGPCAKYNVIEKKPFVNRFLGYTVKRTGTLLLRELLEIFIVIIVGFENASTMCGH